MFIGKGHNFDFDKPWEKAICMLNIRIENCKIYKSSLKIIKMCAVNFDCK